MGIIIKIGIAYTSLCIASFLVMNAFIEISGNQSITIFERCIPLFLALFVAIVISIIYYLVEVKSKVEPISKAK